VDLGIKGVNHSGLFGESFDQSSITPTIFASLSLPAFPIRSKPFAAVNNFTNAYKALRLARLPGKVTSQKRIASPIREGFARNLTNG